MKRMLSAAALGTWLLSSAAVSAQPDEGAKLVARELMAKGRAQREAKDLLGALESFSKAHAIMHVPTTLLETARARVDVGQWLEALELLGELSGMPPAPDEPAPFARARSDAQELAQSLEPRVPSIRLDLSGAPQGPAPSVSVDGVARPDCFSSCRVNPGTHLIMARTPRAVAEEQLTLHEAEQPRLELVFSPLEMPRAPAVAADDSAPVAASSRPIPLTTWITGSVALAGVTAGTVLGLHAVSERDDLRQRCAPQCATDDVDAIRREAVLANVSFAVGLSAAALAATSYVIISRSSRPSPGQRQLGVAAAPDPDGRGGYVALGGRF